MDLLSFSSAVNYICELLFIKGKGGFFWHGGLGWRDALYQVPSSLTC